VSLIRLERSNGIARLGLDRPGRRNAINLEMVAEIEAALEALRSEPNVLVIYSCTPGIFAAGADLAELIERDADAALLGINARMLEAVERHRWPTIAVVDGPALGGGCELALACDLRVVSERARFGQPELNLGIVAGAGANWRLVATVGLALARRMLYAGYELDAQAALAAGLADELFSSDELLQQALRLAQTISTRSWRALELTKLALALYRQPTTAFDMTAQAMLFEGRDKRERMQAFLDERDRRRAQAPQRGSD
jgi:enoyl-CoA hydratase